MIFFFMLQSLFYYDMMNQVIVRKYQKRRRMQHFDYSSVGAYFITICTLQRQNYFWTKDSFKETEDISYSDIGKAAAKAIERIPVVYPSVQLTEYVIMPNHIHLLLELTDNDNNITNIINQTKGRITKEANCLIFQKSFHDHIIRTEKEYSIIRHYIRNNPRKWKEDCYFLAE